MEKEIVGDPTMLAGERKRCSAVMSCGSNWEKQQGHLINEVKLRKKRRKHEQEGI